MEAVSGDNPATPQKLDACSGTVLKILTDEGNMWLVGHQFANDLVKCACQGFDGKVFSTMRERVFQQFTRHVVSSDDEDTDALFRMSK